MIEDSGNRDSIASFQSSTFSPQSSSLITDDFAEVTATLLSRGNSVRFRATGSSMYPTIREGEAITVEPVNPCDVKLGDILLYQGVKGVLAHRVVAITRTEQRGLSNEPEKKQRPGDPLVLSPQSSSLMTSFILHGDALSTCDAPAESGQVLGRVVLVERDDRSIVLNSRVAKLKQTMRLTASRLRAYVASNLAPIPNRFTIRRDQAGR